jgi:hypothetical protein
MKKHIITLPILMLLTSIFIFNACKKDVMPSSDIKFRFTLEALSDQNPNKSTLPPMGYLFLYDDKRNIVKEQIIEADKETEISTTKDGQYSIGIFLRNLTYSSETPNFYFYQNIATNIRLSIKDFTPVYYTHYLYLKLTGISQLDSFKIYKNQKEFFDFDAVNKTYIVKANGWIQNNLLNVYMNGKIDPEYIYLKDKDINGKKYGDTLTLNINEFLKSKKITVNFSRIDDINLRIYANLENKMINIGNKPSSIMSTFASNPTNNIVVPDITGDSYFCTLDNPSNEFFFTKVKNLEDIFTLPNFDYSYTKKSNNDIICTNKNNAKVVESFYDFRKSENDKILVNFRGYFPITNNSIETFQLDLPETIVKKYSLTNIKRFNFDSYIVSWQNSNFDYQQYVKNGEDFNLRCENGYYGKKIQ